MAKDFSIEGSALVITEGGAVIFESPKRDVYFDNSALENDSKVVLYDTNGTNKNASGIFTADLSECTNGGTPFTNASFRTFGRDSLGFSQGGGSPSSNYTKNGYYGLLTDFYFGGTGTETIITESDVDTWIDVNFTIDSNGTFDFRPQAMQDAVNDPFDSSTSLFTLEGLTTKDFGNFRASMSFDPDEDNGEVNARLEFERHSGTTPSDPFPIEDIVATMNDGAATDYTIEPFLSFFIGDTIDTNGAGDAGRCKFQIKSTVPGVLTMRALTWYLLSGNAENSNTPTPPDPTPTPLFIPLSWEGTHFNEYSYSIDGSTASNYNKITRVGTQSFDRAIFSQQTFSSNDDVYLVADSLTTQNNNAFFVGLGLKSNTGTDFPDLEFAMFINGTSILIFESGTNIGTVATTTLNDVLSYRMEYLSSGSVKFYINNNLVHTSTTNFSDDTLCIKLLGRNNNNVLGQHLALVSGLVPDKFLGGIGDSITFGRTVTGNATGLNYVELVLSSLSNTYFTNPLLAVSGAVTTDMVSDQLPLAANAYDASRSENVYLVMAGINDLRTSVTLATIQSNITTIVNSLQTTGFKVVLQTVLKDFNTDWADRYTLNTWILNNTVGADYIVDHTTTLMETDSSYYEVDQLHPNALGMELIASTVTSVINTI